MWHSPLMTVISTNVHAAGAVCEPSRLGCRCMAHSYPMPPRPCLPPPTVATTATYSCVGRNRTLNSGSAGRPDRAFGLGWACPRTAAMRTTTPPPEVHGSASVWFRDGRSACLYPRPGCPDPMRTLRRRRRGQGSLVMVEVVAHLMSHVLEPPSSARDTGALAHGTRAATAVPARSRARSLVS